MDGDEGVMAGGVARRAHGYGDTLELVLGLCQRWMDAHNLGGAVGLPHLAGRLEFIPHIKGNEYYASERPCVRVS